MQRALVEKLVTESRPLVEPKVKALEQSIATRLGIFGQTLHALVPRVAQIVMNTTFRMFPDSAAAKGEKGGKATLSAEAIAMSQMMRGIHF